MFLSRNTQKISPYWLVAAHFGFLFLMGAVGSLLGIFVFNWETIQLAPYDPSWYRNINLHGYYFDDSQQSSVAFFPLFPFIWRWLGVNEWGITIFNLLLLLVSLLWLVKEYKLSKTETLITCSSAGLFYCWLPFSESVFLFTSVVLITGYKRNNQWMIIAGLFLASLSRSAAVVFIPAVTAVAVLQLFNNTKSKTQIIKLYAGWLLACVTAVALVVVIQWYDTGLWMVFGKAHEMWNKRFQLPRLPIDTWDNFRVLFFDSSAMIVGGLSGFLLLGFLLKKKSTTTTKLNADYVFALSYLCFVTIVSLLFGVQGERGTYINSLNRYIFGTAFFLIIVIYHLRHQTFSYAGLALFAGAAVVGVGLTGYFGNPYNELQILPARLDAVAIVLCFIAYYLLKKYRQPVFFLLIYLLQAALQLHFFELYLKQNWVG